MNRRYRRILRRIDKGEKPVLFEGADASDAAELIEAGYATGQAVRGSAGTVERAAATGLTFEGRNAMDESSVWFRVERVKDFLIGIAAGAVAGAIATAGAQLLLELAHAIMKHGG